MKKKSNIQIAVTFDPEADASYVYFSSDGTQHADIGHTFPIHNQEGFLVGAIDFDAAGRAIGLEILHASTALPIHWVQE